MEVETMNRKEFLGTTLGVGFACLTRPCRLSAQEPSSETPGHSCAEKVDFAEGWVRRFFDVLDESLDSDTKARIMMANGRSCWRSYIQSTGRKITPVAFDEWAAKVKSEVTDDSLRVEGNVIYMQYNKNYQGLDAPEGFCLCPLVESKPEGLSTTYCQCSVGYVKEMFEMRLGRPVEVQLLDSVLAGGKRCKFKIDVSES